MTHPPITDDIIEALRNLAAAEATYRATHDLEGEASPKTGRTWDLMRRAGDKARAALEAALPKEMPDLPPVMVSQGGFAYNGEHILYWRNRALKAEAALTAALACQHKSDCATNNGPALPPGPCDCGAGKEGDS